MKTKICSACKIEKLLTEFHKQKDKKYGLSCACKDCRSIRAKKRYLFCKEKILKQSKEYYETHKNDVHRRHKNYYLKNREKTLKWGKEYRESNPEREYNRHKRYNQLHREENNKYLREKDKTNPKFHLNRIIGSAILHALKGKKAGRKWESLVGYTIKDLMNHLEKQFDEKMNWFNHGIYWHIDHIKPRSLFKYEKPEDEEFKQCWALDNLQPLEKSANMKKYNHFAQDYKSGHYEVKNNQDN